MLAPYTSAPPRHIRFGTAAETGEQRAAYQQNPASIPGAILPYPSEEVMRQGRLAFAESGDVGETTNMTGSGCLLSPPVAIGPCSGLVSNQLTPFCNNLVTFSRPSQPSLRLRRLATYQQLSPALNPCRKPAISQESRFMQCRSLLLLRTTRRTLASIWI